MALLQLRLTLLDWWNTEGGVDYGKEIYRGTVLASYAWKNMLPIYVKQCSDTRRQCVETWVPLRIIGEAPGRV